MIAQYRTSVPPINEFVTRMKSLEGKDGILSVSLSHGFAFADVEDVGTRTLVVADRDKGKAEKLAKQLGEELWANRERYATKYLSIPEAMERAASHNQGPLVLAQKLTEVLAKNGLESADNETARHQIYVTGSPERFTDTARHLFGQDLPPITTVRLELVEGISGREGAA